MMCGVSAYVRLSQQQMRLLLVASCLSNRSASRHRGEPFHLDYLEITKEIFLFEKFCVICRSFFLNLLAGNRFLCVVDLNLRIPYCQVLQYCCKFVKFGDDEQWSV